MSRKSKIIVSITGIVLISLILIGLTFAYYLTNIVGNTKDKSITLSIANLELTYSDGNGLIEAKNIIPGENIDTKTFSVENTGDAKVENYTVYLDSVVNTFVDKSDVKLTLTCTSTNGGNCSGTTIEYPSSSTMLSVNDIDVDERHDYELTVEFLETYDDQSDNMNKTLSGNIKIKDLRSTDKMSNTLASANTVTLDNNDYIKGYRIYGNSLQDGTPSPTSPVEIQSVGDYDTETDKYVIPVSVTGKNLFDQDGWYEFYKNNDGTLKELLTNNVIVDGYNTISWHPANGHNGSYIKYPFKGKENTQYTITFTCKGESVQNGSTTGMGFRYTDGTSSVFYCGNTTEWNSVVGVTSSNKTVEYLFMPYNYGVKVYFQKESIRLYEGVYTLDTIDDYEPYKELITNIYLDEPLRKINNISDYIDFQEQKVVRNVKEINFNGEENWGLYQNSSVGPTFTIGMTDTKLEYNSSLCTHYTNIIYAWDQVYIDRVGIYSDHNTAKMKYFRPPNSSITTPEDFKSWLASQKNNNNIVKLNYLLEKSIEESIELPSILLQDGISNISIDTSLKPFNVELDIIN